MALTLWSTILTQYHELRGDTYTPPTVSTLEESPIEVPPSPFEVVVSELMRGSATNTPIVDEPRQLPTTTESVPFTPIPVPTPPPITPVIPQTEPTEVPTPPPIVPDVDEKVTTENLLKGSIVNIICIQSGGLRGASGSGVVVDPRGIIITVAHVAQNFLLTDYPTENAGNCYIRTGSPAKNAYTAELVFISPDWIEENPSTFLTSRPTGTGEDDFAFLAITGSLSGTPLPARFNYIPLAGSGTDIDEGDQVGIGSYAAEFLTSSQVRSSLYPTISFGPVNDVYTFGRNTVDIFSVRAGYAAQEGSSGGAVINDDLELIGLITTRTVRPDLSMRDLQALTMDHIRRSFREDMGSDFDSYMRSSPSTLIENFRDEAADLLDILEESIAEARS